MRKRVVRGGGWSSKPRRLRSANRSRISADAAANNRGFRLIREDAAEPDPVIRSGSWKLDADYCRFTCRIKFVPGYRYDLGFRLVQEVRND